MVKILVTGANGQLGKELEKLSPNFSDFKFLFYDKNALDIADADAVRQCFEQEEINYCVNCAAYTAVDKAEEEEELAFKINALGPENLAKACDRSQATLIQISTDFVFDGKQSTPYKETDLPSPLSVYGKSKLKGELTACENNPKTIVIRTSWLYSWFGKNFLKTILRLTKEREELKVVYDQIGTPTQAADLAEAILKIILKLEEGNISDPYGLYHYSNEGVASWYDFAAAILEMSGSKIKLLPILSEDFPTPAQRPALSVLDKRKIKEVFGLEIGHWMERLKN